MNFQTNDTGKQMKNRVENAKQTDVPRMSCSGILRKDGKKIIYVRLERGKDYAEGTLPEAKVLSHSGFFEDELAQFEQYLEKHKFEIIEQAKTIDLMKTFMGSSAGGTKKTP